jgi:hypothetical protein
MKNQLQLQPDAFPSARQRGFQLPLSVGEKAVDKSPCQAIIQQACIFVWYADASHTNYPKLLRLLALLALGDM